MRQAHPLGKRNERKDNDMSQLGSTLLIANPQARSGKALRVAEHLHRRLTSMLSERRTALPALVFTQRADDATLIAREHGANFDTVMTLGGDGVVHEVVNGLMQLERHDRPQLAVIPYGNGDDFARTLGMDRNPEKALQQIVEGNAYPMDVGCANGEWFDESFSLGLDASIALGTIELRERTKRTGTVLYVQAAMDNLLNHFNRHKFKVGFDGVKPQELDAYLIAVQNGRYYGGGFQITPEASLEDGVFDVCWASGPFSKPRAAAIFARAKLGRHTGAKGLHFTQARTITIEVVDEVACQVDGEPLSASRYDIRLEPKALTVIKPR